MSLFVVPVVQSGRFFTPKYIHGVLPSYTVANFPHGTFLVSAEATQQQQDDISAHADAIVIPPLDDGVALNATVNTLESLDVPAQWVTADMTYRTVVRTVFGAMEFLGRVSAIAATQIPLAGHLGDTFASLPLAVRNAMTQAASELGLSTSGVTGSTTVRQILAIVGAQYAGGSMSFGAFNGIL